MGSEHFVVNGTAIVNGAAIVNELDALLSLVASPAATVTQETLSGRGLVDAAAALMETGLLIDERSATPSVDRVSFTHALVQVLRRGGISVRGLDDSSAGRVPEVLLHVDVDGADDVAGMREAVRQAASRGIPLLMVVLEWGGASVSPLVALGQRGCGFCLHSRHLATLPAEVSEIRGPKHRVIARRSPCWPTPTVIERLAAAMAELIANRGRRAIRIPWDGSVATQHNFLPVPSCQVCGPWSPDAVAGTAPLPFPLAVDRAVDSWCGLVTSVADSGEAFGLHTALAGGVLPIDESGLPQARVADRARGAATTSATARSLAIVEALERHAARSPWLATATSNPPVADARIGLRELWPYAAEQLADWGTTAEAGYFSDRWVRAEYLDAEPVWVPEAALRIGRRRTAAQVTSNGFAAGPSTSFARGRAIAELIERDAVMTTWFHRRPAVRLPVRQLGGWAEGAAANLARVGVRVSLWSLAAAADVPVVLAVAEADGQAHPTLSLGAACAASIPAAAERALRELASNVAATAAEIVEGGLLPVAAAAVTTIDQHAAYYRDPATANALDFLDLGTPPVPAVELERTVQIEDQCRSAGLRIAVVDITPPDIAQCGLRVIRAVSPDLVPIWFGWHREPLEHPRLRCSAPNREPHPFR